MKIKLEPWAWAVVDPQSRLRNEDGDTVDRMICWEIESANHYLECAMDSLEEGDEEPYIVELFPMKEILNEILGKQEEEEDRR